MHGIIGVMNIHHFICVSAYLFVKSEKDGALFCRRPNHSTYLLFGPLPDIQGAQFNCLPQFWRASWLGAAFGWGGCAGGGRRESALHRSVFHALWLPCSRGRRCSVHLGPPVRRVLQKGVKPGGVAGSSRPSLVLQL